MYIQRFDCTAKKLDCIQIFAQHSPVTISITCFSWSPYYNLGRCKAFASSSDGFVAPLLMFSPEYYKNMQNNIPITISENVCHCTTFYSLLAPS